VLKQFLSCKGMTNYRVGPTSFSVRLHRLQHDHSSWMLKIVNRELVGFIYTGLTTGHISWHGFHETPHRPQMQRYLTLIKVYKAAATPNVYWP